MSGASRWNRIRRAIVFIPVALIVVIAAVLWIGDRYEQRQETRDLRAHLAGSLRRVKFHSRILKADRVLFVYIPMGYDDPANSGKTYPTLYLLHGCPGQARDWIVKGRAHVTLEKMILAKAVRPMILVMPDLEGPHGPFDCSGAMNRPDGSWSMEDHFVREVVACVDSTYRTIPDRDHRALAGLSMGGFAAVNLTVRHPDEFGTACSMSGYFRAGDFKPIAQHVMPGRRDLWRANSPQDTIGKLNDRRRVHVYLDCGAEDGYLPENEAFAARLKELGVEHGFQVSRGGHSFKFWGRQLRNCILYADEHFPPQP
jgi:enterochelin esterase-like enzyme